MSFCFGIPSPYVVAVETNSPHLRLKDVRQIQANHSAFAAILGSLSTIEALVVLWSLSFVVCTREAMNIRIVWGKLLTRCPTELRQLEGLAQLCFELPACLEDTSSNRFGAFA